MEQHQQAMLQLHLNDQQFIAYWGAAYKKHNSVYMSVCDYY